MRLDRVRRPAKAMWDGPPTLAEENEDSDTCLGNGMSGLNDIVLNTTLYNDLGKFQEVAEMEKPSINMYTVHLKGALNFISVYHNVFLFDFVNFFKIDISIDSYIFLYLKPISVQFKILKHFVPQ